MTAVAERSAVVASVARVERVAEDVVALTLTGPDLPSWQAGAHVDVHLPSGAVRQYSLCSDPADLMHQRIAVRLDAGGRGGSAELHALASTLTELTISLPRNAFALVDAPSYTLVAGGIGVTPILAMAYELAGRGARPRVVYLGSSRRRMPFVAELAALADLQVVETALTGRPPIAGLLGDVRDDAVYACGPQPLLTDVEACAGTARYGVHVERFAPALIDGDTFTVELARTGGSVEVGGAVSVLEAVRAAGVDVPSSCEMGICGTCETAVLDGAVEHRDDILTDAERCAGASMMICVSRCLGRRLVLDL